MRKRIYLLQTLLLCAVMIFLSGCNEQAPTTQPPSAQPTASQPPSAQTPGNVQTQTPTGDGQVYVIRIATTDETHRAEVIIQAAEILTKQLAEENSGDIVVAQYIPIDAGQIQNNMALWAKTGEMPEIIARTNADVTAFANSGFLIDVEYITEGEVYTREVEKRLRDMGRVDGVMYGIIQDMEIRPMIFYKPALEALGYNEQSMLQLRNDIGAGRFTVADLQQLAKRAVDEGITQYGIMHRPNNGPEFRNMHVTFNRGQIPYRDGKVIINRQSWIDQLTYMRTNVQMGLTPYNSLTDFTWDLLEGDIWPNGKTLCWYGLISHKWDILTIANITSEYFDQNFFTTPLPVSVRGDPSVSMSNPYFYALTKSAESSEKMKEYCKRVMEIVLEPELQLQVSLATAHMAITERTLSHPSYQADYWLTSNQYLLDYAFILPSNQYVNMMLTGADTLPVLQAAELEALNNNPTPIARLVDDFIGKVIFQVGEGNYILE